MTSKKSETIKELQGLLAEELEAFLRYFQLRYRVPEGDRETAEGIFGKAQEETLEHAGLIATHIQALGAVPELRIRMSSAGTATTLQEAIEETLAFEQEALDAYKDMLQRTAGDARLEAFVNRQIAIETDHVREIERLLR